MKQNRTSRRKRIIGLAGALLAAAVLFACWWYGAFSNLGKSGSPMEYKPNFCMLTREPDWREEQQEKLRRSLKKAKTELVVKAYAEYCIHEMAENPYAENLAFVKEQANLYEQELLRRNNAASLLLKAYRKMPVMVEAKISGTEYNARALARLEQLLTEPQIRRHLNPIDRMRLSRDADRKQKEKEAIPDAPEYAHRNFLHTDSYRTEDGVVFWKGEK